MILAKMMNLKRPLLLMYDIYIYNYDYDYDVASYAGH